jgi:hypothetical protein
MKMYVEMEAELQTFLTLALDRGKWSASHHLVTLNLGKEPPVPTG